MFPRGIFTSFGLFTAFVNAVGFYSVLWLLCMSVRQPLYGCH